MTTLFSLQAHRWTDESIKDAKDKKYFKSWIDTIPARVNYLADAITNICSIPFNLLQTFFYSLQALYTWGYETQSLTDTIKILHNKVNYTASSITGIIFTELGKNLRTKNNLKHISTLCLSISIVNFALLVLNNIKGFSLVYKPIEGVFEPNFYWEVSKKVN